MGPQDGADLFREGHLYDNGMGLVHRMVCPFTTLEIFCQL